MNTPQTQPSPAAQDQNLLLVALAALVIFLGVIDLMTGYALSFSIFYLIPICIVTWRVGRWTGVIFALFSMLIWGSADLLARGGDINLWILAWNATVRLGFFLIFVTVFSLLKEALERETIFARTDFLTHIPNNHFFTELADLELQRCRRFKRPFSIAYLDCDNFKKINDRRGHRTGNELLKIIAGTIRADLRGIDTVARMGGDEFVILMPETDDAAALHTISRLHHKLQQTMMEGQWPVTFSIGLASFEVIPHSVAEALEKADTLMYRAKSKGKNTICQEAVKLLL